MKLREELAEGYVYHSITKTYAHRKDLKEVFALLTLTESAMGDF